MKLLAMMGLFFLVVCAVGILRPIKNSLALDGLGATDFYKVYLVSATVVLFAPIYKHLADRIAWRTLFPLVALFFALNLVVFRLVYVPGSAVFGVVFYGWYDLFAAALVAQFFMATQLFFNARSAKQAYPLVIGGGALGATIGGLITGFSAERVGAPNLMLVAAGIILVFAAGLPFIYSETSRAKPRDIQVRITAFNALWNNKHIRLIAASVLLTIVVKELVDYQFNALSKDVFQTRDAVSAFQGKFNAVTQWLPLLFVLLLHPLLKRYGVGIAILLLPVALLLTNVALAVWWGLLAVSAAKGAETTLRYSAERASREILYLPVPENVRMTAKAYIDVAIEKGFGKAISAVLIFVLLHFVVYRQLVYVTIVLAALSVIVAMAMRREYVRTLATAMEGRLVSLRGGFASILDAATLPRVREVLRSADPLQVAFALDLLEHASPAEARSVAAELGTLLTHESDTIRERAAELLARAADAGNQETLEQALHDPVTAVREAAARALIAGAADPTAMWRDLLASEHAHVRTAVLAQLAELDVPAEVRQRVAELHTASREQSDVAPRDANIEAAYAAQALGPAGWRVLLPLLSADDAEVAKAALRAAGALRSPELLPACIRALRPRATRAAARSALRSYGDSGLTALATVLLDPAADPLVRRQIPAVLARLPSPDVVAVLLRAITARETDQVLDFRALKALGKLRKRFPTLEFPREAVKVVCLRQVQAADQYATARQAVAHASTSTPAAILLMQALTEAWRERRECAFRCLALSYAPAPVLNAYSAICSSDRRSQANALEWLEHEAGYELVTAMAPVLVDPQERGSTSQPAEQVLSELSDDEDSWIAMCARAVCADHGSLQSGPLRYAVTTVIQQDVAMEIIERVFLLQRVDLLRGARSAHLALLASIAEQMDIEAGTELLQRGQPASAMFVLMRGRIELHGVADQRILVEEGSAFGTWALIDDAPSMISARALEPSQVLLINREDFFDLLGDTPELALGLLQGLARRVRKLVA